MENALQVIEEYEGEELYINKLHDAFRSVWQKKLKSESKQFTVTELAHRYGISESHVRRIIEDPRQISMFKSESSS